jgi:two-component system LytT family response regulator
MKVLIIEDEPLGAEALKNLLVECDETIEVLSVKDSIVSSAEWLSTHEAPDLIFMDIELADGQCFELFKEVEIKSPVIFTTSYDAYALKAFRFNSVDYLLNPTLPISLHRGKYLLLKALKAKNIFLTIHWINCSLCFRLKRFTASAGRSSHYMLL